MATTTPTPQDDAVAPAPAPAPGSGSGNGPLGLLVVRGVIGGIMMGLANLVPGISGGTMLVATGIYRQFVNAIAEVTTFKFRLRSMVLLGSVVVAAALAIVLLAGVMVHLVTTYAMIMFSLFIGLTLGGVPLIKKMLGKATASAWAAGVVMFVAMAGLAYVQSFGQSGGGSREGFLFMLIAGLVAAGAMILPGVSGGYMFLLLGVYVPVLVAIRDIKNALPVAGELDVNTLTSAGMSVVLPVGIGVVCGVVGVSNALKWLLKRYEKATLGVLMGLLLGAVVGLWPFQKHVPAAEVGMVKGQEVMIMDGALVYMESREPVADEDHPSQPRAPHDMAEGGAALGLIIVGFGATMLLARLGRAEASRKSVPSRSAHGH